MTWSNTPKNLDRKVLLFQSGKIVKLQNNKVLFLNFEIPTWGSITSKVAQVWNALTKNI